jgi:hypothetical protein
MIALTFVLLAASPTAEPLQTLDGHARRGAVIAQLDGIAAASAQACQSACQLNAQCQAWTWRSGWIGQPARCVIHAIALNPRPHPGAVTGLAPALSSRIDAAIDRPPTARELTALDEASQARRTRSGDLDGG